MKKLLFIFVALLALVITSGCGAKQNTVRFNSEGTPTSTTSADDQASKTSDTVPAAKDGETDELVAKNDVKNVKKEPETPKTISEVSPTGKLAVTSFDGGLLKTTFGYNVVKGTAPTGTKRITINDYRLSKYIGGQTKWDYIASTRFGTMKSGLNTYVVKTYDAKNVETDSLIFTINYEAPAAPAVLPAVGSSLWFTLLTTLMLSGIYAFFSKLRWL